ncbi:hypothetical protein [Petrotoga sp. 9PWA.NaAc.5.4]|uniref:InlB B-repeat-containing protein n=1 Tax=Petrotoga sp. 9PWA.NaAc.5.4 TaxID=1434328 RepID=UPI000CB060FB|nr:hypothetical protein [Petrotoga sp. 9PWA.NaAc.5.4]PNR95387.1 hypothetical protein X924_04700 [Petrotoga sp. 9PWA.NaAc.5.4]
MSKKKLTILTIITVLVLALVGCATVETRNYTLKVEVSLGDSVKVGDEEVGPEETKEFQIEVNTEVVLEVVPEESYVFDKWVGTNKDDVKGTTEENKYKIKMNGNKEIKAVFKGEEEEIETLPELPAGAVTILAPVIEDIGWEKDGMTNQAIVELEFDEQKNAVKVTYEMQNEGQVAVSYENLDANPPKTKFYLEIFVDEEAEFNWFRAFMQTKKDENNYPMYPSEWPYVDRDKRNEWQTLEIDMTGVDEGEQIYKWGFHLGADADATGTFWVGRIYYIGD